MMRRNLALISFFFFPLFSSSVLSQPGDATKPAFVGLPPPEELKVLGGLVGNWAMESVVRPSVEAKKGFTATGMARGKWLHNHHFIRLEGASESKTGRLEFTLLFSYDRNKKTYRRWAFTSAGIAAESTGKWDVGTNTMTWTPVFPSTKTTATVTSVIRTDRFVETFLFKRNDGTILKDVTVTAVRQGP